MHHAEFTYAQTVMYVSTHSNAAQKTALVMFLKQNLSLVSHWQNALQFPLLTLNTAKPKQAILADDLHL